jgi:hypothetical protein
MRSYCCRQLIVLSVPEITTTAVLHARFQQMVDGRPISIRHTTGYSVAIVAFDTKDDRDLVYVRV